MKKTSLVIFFVIIIFSLNAESGLDKNSGTIFSSDILDEGNLYISLDGSWKFDLNTFANGNLSEAFSNIIFTQTPNVTASLWLFNMFFFETQITENSEENIFLLGYQNNYGFLKEFRIGNDDLNISSYADYIPPINKDRSPGTRFKFTNTNSEHEILGRYTSETNDSVSYRGYKNIEKTTLQANNYLKGQSFVIPIENNLDFDVYIIKDSTSDLEKLDNQEYIYYSNENLLYIDDKDFTDLYIKIDDYNFDKYDLYYFIKPLDNPGITVEPTEDELWDLYVKEINTEKYLNLYTKGVFSPFEHLGVFDFSEILTSSNENVELYINNVKSSNYITHNQLIVISNPDSNFNDLNFRYPFLDDDKDLYTKEGSGLNSEILLTLNVFEVVSEISVPKTAKENSLSITMNGINYQDFKHDSDSGIVTFGKDISPFDEIVINYKNDSFPGTGNLLLSYGSRFKPREDLTFEFSNTGSWDFSSDDYSYEYATNIGQLNSLAQIKYETEFIKSKLTTNLKVKNHDTLGKLLLFEYDQGQINIPINSTSISDVNSGTNPLISRYTDDYSYTINEISDLDENPLGGAYYVKHLYNENSYNVIAIENSVLSSGQSSTAIIELDDYTDNYTWATEFKFEYLNTGSDRDITIKFNNPGLTDVLTKENITLIAGSDYQEFTINFSRDDRAKLLNLDSLEIIIGEGLQNLILIKGFELIGDSLITHSGSDNIQITKYNDSMKIKSKQVYGTENIIVSSKLSSIDLNSYGNLQFTLDNTNLLDDQSSITLEFKNYDDTVYRLTIPQGYLSIGTNTFEIDIQNSIVYLNNLQIDDLTWEKLINDKDVNFFTLNINQFNEGVATISEFILKDPQLSFYNESSLEISATPPIDISIGNIPVLDAVEIKLVNKIINNETSSYTGNSELSFNLFGMNIWNKLEFEDQLNNVSYKVQIPYFPSPIKLTDAYTYNINSSRTSTLKIDTKYYDMNLSLTDTTGESKGLQVSKIINSISYEKFLTYTNTINITKERNDEVLGIENEITDSYLKIIPTNELGLYSKLDSETTLQINPSIMSSNIKLTNAIKQKTIPVKTDINSYGLETSVAFSIGKISLTPKISSEYKINELYNDKATLEDIFYRYFYIFEIANPYSSLTMGDIFLSKNRSSFYEENLETTEKSLYSGLSIKVTNSYRVNTFIDCLIPHILTYEINKSFSKEDSKETTLLNNKIEGEFTFNSELKNSISISDQFNIELNTNSLGLEWKLFFYKNIYNDNTLDISNTLNINADDIINITNIDFIWLGKTGPVLIVPIINKIFNSPYKYINKEMLYINIESEKNGFGFRHETNLTIKDSNETSFFIDLGYKTYSTDKLSFEMGLFTTLIF